MLSRLMAPVANFVKKRGRQSPPHRSVSDLLAALADVRARKAQLDQEEKDLIAATRARLREQQEALEDLRRKVVDHGIEVTEHAPSVPIPGLVVEGSALRPSQHAPLTN